MYLYLMQVMFPLFYPESIRLVNGRSECSGRLEISHNGLWGTICDDEWGMSNTDVVCRQLGCGHGISFGNDFGQGHGPIWLDNVACTGEEDAITQCPHQDYGENNCGHSEDVSVVCLGKRTSFVSKNVIVICMVLICLSDIDFSFFCLQVICPSHMYL